MWISTNCLHRHHFVIGRDILLKLAKILLTTKRTPNAVPSMWWSMAFSECQLYEGGHSSGFQTPSNIRCHVWYQRIDDNAAGDIVSPVLTAGHSHSTHCSMLCISAVKAPLRSSGPKSSWIRYELYAWCCQFQRAWHIFRPVVGTLGTSRQSAALLTCLIRTRTSPLDFTHLCQNQS